MARKLAALEFICAAILLMPAPAFAATMSWSQVGMSGNAAAVTGLGAVNYSYSIGTFDVTVNQYIAFLNANDPTGADPVGLDNSNMSNPTYGGVNFNSTAAQGQMYSAISGTGNHPINYVTWYDAIRFANWMDNGQPICATEPSAADNATESGSYTLDGFTTTPSNGNSITRNPGARQARQTDCRRRTARGLQQRLERVRRSSAGWLAEDRFKSAVVRS